MVDRRGVGGPPSVSTYTASSMVGENIGGGIDTPPLELIRDPKVFE